MPVRSVTEDGHAEKPARKTSVTRIEYRLVIAQPASFHRAPVHVRGQFYSSSHRRETHENTHMIATVQCLVDERVSIRRLRVDMTSRRAICGIEAERRIVV